MHPTAAAPDTGDAGTEPTSETEQPTAAVEQSAAPEEGGGGAAPVRQYVQVRVAAALPMRSSVLPPASLSLLADLHPASPYLALRLLARVLLSRRPRRGRQDDRPDDGLVEPPRRALRGG